MGAVKGISSRVVPSLLLLLTDRGGPFGVGVSPCLATGPTVRMAVAAAREGPRLPSNTRAAGLTTAACSRPAARSHNRLRARLTLASAPSLPLSMYLTPAF